MTRSTRSSAAGGADASGTLWRKQAAIRTGVERIGAGHVMAGLFVTFHRRMRRGRKHGWNNLREGIGGTDRRLRIDTLLTRRQRLAITDAAIAPATWLPCRAYAMRRLREVRFIGVTDGQTRMRGDCKHVVRATQCGSGYQAAVSAYNGRIDGLTTDVRCFGFVRIRRVLPALPVSPSTCILRMETLGIDLVKMGGGLVQCIPLRRREIPCAVGGTRWLGWARIACFPSLPNPL